jgi:hypothetical protein
MPSIQGEDPVDGDRRSVYVAADRESGFLDPDDPTSLQRLPREIRDRLGNGFRSILKFDRKALDTALSELARSFPRPPDLQHFARSVLGVPLEEASDIAAALALFMAIVESAGPKEALSRLTASSIASADEASRLAVVLVPSYEEQKETLQRRVAEQNVASRVLPNLTEIRWTVDLRARYSGGKPSMLVPVAILDLDTDLDGSRLLCQASASEIERLLEAVQKMKERMDDLRQVATKLAL